MRMDGGRGRVVAAIGLAALLVGCFGGGVSMGELADEDPNVRADAAHRMGQARSAEAVDALIAALDDPVEAVRINVILALGKIGDPRAIDALAERMEDPAFSIRLSVAQAFEMMKAPESLPLLQRLMFDEHDTVRLTATRALAAIPGDQSMNLLLTQALRDENEKVREFVIRVLGERRSREAIPLIEDALLTEADNVRANAAAVLGDIGDPSSAPVLTEALDDEFYKVRSLSAHALSRIAPDDEQVRLALHTRLETEEQQITQVDIAWALARMGDRSELHRVRDLLFRGQPEDVRAEAATALGEVGELSDIELLKRASNDKKGLVARDALESLEKLSGE